MVSQLGYVVSKQIIACLINQRGKFSLHLRGRHSDLEKLTHIFLLFLRLFTTCT